MSDASVNAEIQRLQCLQALGITVYHPRYRLPGAKPSEQGVWPELEAAVPAKPAARAESAEPVPRVEVKQPSAQATSAREPLHRAETSTAAAKPAKVSAAAAAPVAPLQNFQLLFLQIDADLALINQIPALARPQLQDKQLALLGNMLRWLGKPVPAQAPRVFRWPLPGLEHMAASMSAQTSLQHFLEQAHSERSFRFLLQLGPQAVGPETKEWAAFATHSLDEMLALPSLKREVWQALLPLHAALHPAR